MVVLLITAGTSACVGILSQIQHSKCVHIQFCFGCTECTRVLPRDDDSNSIELKNVEKALTNIDSQKNAVLKI